MILTLEDLPIRIRNRELRKDKYRDQKEENIMSRARTNEMRRKPMGANGVCKQGVVKGPGSKQYFQTGKKDTGPNYPQPSKTGPLQNGK